MNKRKQNIRFFYDFNFTKTFICQNVVIFKLTFIWAMLKFSINHHLSLTSSGNFSYLKKILCYRGTSFDFCDIAYVKAGYLRLYPQPFLYYFRYHSISIVIIGHAKLAMPFLNYTINHRAFSWALTLRFFCSPCSPFRAISSFKLPMRETMRDRF